MHVHRGMAELVNKKQYIKLQKCKSDYYTFEKTSVQFIKKRDLSIIRRWIQNNKSFSFSSDQLIRIIKTQKYDVITVHFRESMKDIIRREHGNRAKKKTSKNLL